MDRLFKETSIPTNGAEGTLAGTAEAGDGVYCIADRGFYENTGSKASPTWTLRGKDWAGSGGTDYATGEPLGQASLQVLRDARANGQGGLALAAVDRVQRQIDLQAKLLGELDERPVVNVLVSSEWLRVRAAVLAALAPHPAARATVAEALAGLDAAA